MIGSMLTAFHTSHKQQSSNAFHLGPRGSAFLFLAGLLTAYLFLAFLFLLLLFLFGFGSGGLGLFIDDVEHEGASIHLCKTK
jgi:hypothetical protein